MVLKRRFSCYTERLLAGVGAVVNEDTRDSPAMEEVRTATGATAAHNEQVIDLKEEDNELPLVRSRRQPRPRPEERIEVPQSEGEVEARPEEATGIPQGNEESEPLVKITEGRSVDFFGNSVAEGAEEGNEATMPHDAEIIPSEGIMMGLLTEQAKKQVDEVNARAEIALGKRVADPPTEELPAADAQGEEGSQENAAKRRRIEEPPNPFGVECFYPGHEGPLRNSTRFSAGLVWKASINPSRVGETGELRFLEDYQRYAQEHVRVMSEANYIVLKYDKALKSAIQDRERVKFAKKNVEKERDVFEMQKVVLEMSEKYAQVQKKEKKDLIEALKAENAELKAMEAQMRALKAENAKMKAMEAQVEALTAENAELKAKEAQIEVLKAEKADSEEKLRKAALLLEQEKAHLRKSREDERRAATVRTQKAIVEEYAGLLTKVKSYVAQWPEVEQIISTMAQIEGVLTFYLGLTKKGFKFPDGILEKLKADHKIVHDKNSSFEEITLAEGELDGPSLVKAKPLTVANPEGLRSG